MGPCCSCCRSSERDGGHRGRRGVVSEAAISGYNKQLFVAIADYVGSSAAEVTLKKGDRVQLLSMEQDNFVFVRAAKTHGTRGYVPMEYLAPLDSCEAEDFFYGGIRGKEANTVLLNPNLPPGSFLVRASAEGQRSNDDYDEICGEETQTPYALSLKDDQTPPRIHHYRITMTETEEYYIKVDRKFNSIRALISFYQSNPEGIPCKLGKCVPRLPLPIRELPPDMRDRWREIPRKELKMMKMLGEGRFGAVHKAVWTQPNGVKLTVVAKQLKQLSLPDKQTLLNEASTMKDLRHVNVIRLYGVVSASEPYYIITEFVKDGSLEDYLKNRDKNHMPALPAPALVDICMQICNGMAYLVGKRLVHRDVAARNMLIDVTTESPFACVVKVADFGLARTLNKQYVYKMKHETYIATRWLSPEAFDKSVFSADSDVWAFGITMAEIYRSGRDPWNDISDEQVEVYMKEGRAPDQPPSMPAEVYDIMVRCCHREPGTRPTFRELADDFNAVLSSMTGKSTRSLVRSPGSSKLSKSNVRK